MGSRWVVIPKHQLQRPSLSNINIVIGGLQCPNVDALYDLGWVLEQSGTGEPKSLMGNQTFQAKRRYPATKIRVRKTDSGIVAGYHQFNIPYIEDIYDDYRHPSAQPDFGKLTEAMYHERVIILSTITHAKRWDYLNDITGRVQNTTTEITVFKDPEYTVEDLPRLYDIILELQRPNADDAAAYLKRKEDIERRSNSIFSVID